MTIFDESESGRLKRRATGGDLSPEAEQREKVRRALMPAPPRPARDSDALERRVEVLEGVVSRMSDALKKHLGFDFEEHDGPPPIAEASHG